MRLSTNHFEHGGLIVSVIGAVSSATVRWQGVSDAREPGTLLSPFLSGLVDSLCDKDVFVDFRKLEYMNSATVSPLINFVKHLDAKGTKTTLLFDMDVPWQKVNARCMRAIARTLSNVQVP
jgi:hypothetical protein